MCLPPASTVSLVSISCNLVFWEVDSCLSRELREISFHVEASRAMRRCFSRSTSPVPVTYTGRVHVRVSDGVGRCTNRSDGVVEWQLHIMVSDGVV